MEKSWKDVYKAPFYAGYSITCDALLLISKTTGNIVGKVNSTITGNFMLKCLDLLNQEENRLPFPGKFYCESKDSVWKIIYRQKNLREKVFLTVHPHHTLPSNELEDLCKTFTKQLNGYAVATNI